MSLSAILVICLILAVFAAFIWEKYPPDLIAFSAFCFLILTGIITYKEAFTVFSNTAPITIAAMLVISAALERTGCVEYLSKYLFSKKGDTYTSLLLRFMPTAMVLSAFMNNTPIVIILTPILASIAIQNKLASSQVLIPLSYAAILGGTTTLIGTSTNLLVSGIALEYEVPAFGIFEITPIGLVLAGAGFIYILFVGKYLLPKRVTLMSLVDEKKYSADLLIPPNSTLIGKSIQSSRLLADEKIEILDLMRGKKSYKNKLEEIAFEEGDRLSIRTSLGEMIGIKESKDVSFAVKPSNFEEIASSENAIVEGIVGPHSKLISKKTSTLILSRYGVNLVAIHRPGKEIKAGLKTEYFEYGDTLLLEGKASDIQNLFKEYGLINLSIPTEPPMRRNKAPIAFLTLLSVVVLTALNFLPLATAALAGAAVVLITRCLDPEDVYQAIDWNILFLIFGMLGLSLGMQKTGAMDSIVKGVVYEADQLGPYVILICLYALSSLLTELITNNAVAVLLTPICIQMAASLGLNPKPFLVAIMLGGSASFATPIGYQTNTFVYGAGGYQFADFLKIGIPMNIIMFFISIILIPIIWSF